MFGSKLSFVAETDRAASAILRRRFIGVQNLGDIRTANWLDVDQPELLTMGIPCQPVSQARAALASATSERWLWDQARRAIFELNPRMVFFENVKGLLSVDFGLAWEQVLADFVALGYGVRWLTIGACAVGAPHHRHRIFLLAEKSAAPEVVRLLTAECGAIGGMPLLPTPTAREGTRRGAGTSAYWEARKRASRRGKESPPLAAVVGMLAEKEQRDGAAFWFGEFEAAVRRWEKLHGPAPFPVFRGPQQGIRLEPAFGEWLMGWERGWSASVEVTRREQLRLIGNGVCLAQAVEALKLLSARVRTPPPAAPLPARPERAPRSPGGEPRGELSAYGVMHATRLPRDVSGRFRMEAERRGVKPAQLQREVLSAFVAGLE